MDGHYDCHPPSETTPFDFLLKKRLSALWVRDFHVFHFTIMAELTAATAILNAAKAKKPKGNVKVRAARMLCGVRAECLALHLERPADRPVAI